MEPRNESHFMRRLSTPFHGMPNVVDYDPDTGYVTFGRMIEQESPVSHPRRYVCPQAPSGEPPGACHHSYCLNERRRLYGLIPPDHPIGLPWATGLLRYMPGQQRYPFPLRRPIPIKRKKVKKQKKKQEESDKTQETTPPRDSNAFKQKQKEIMEAMDEMIYFYKIVMLTGSLLKTAYKEKYGDDTSRINENGEDTTKAAAKEKPTMSKEPSKAEEPAKEEEPAKPETVEQESLSKGETEKTQNQEEADKPEKQEEAEKTVTEAPLEVEDNTAQAT